MADNKVFAGPRIRRLRTGLGLTQVAMAERLGISPSYLNLLERGLRPLTVQLILKMAEVFDVDLADLRGGAATATLAELKAVFADPLLADELPGSEELTEIAEAAPNAAAAIVKLHRAYREGQARLSDLSRLLGQDEARAVPRLPLDEMRERFEPRPHHFAALDGAAEAFQAALEPSDDLFAALKAWLRRERDVALRILPAEAMPLWRRRFDRHSRRLFVSERLSAPDRLRELASEIASVAFGTAIESEVSTFGFSTPEAERLARAELVRYAAHALMMPYTAFQTAAERSGYDVEVLAARFCVSFAQAAERLTSLQRRSAPGLPFFLMEVDATGQRLRRQGARGFPAQRFGGACGRLALGAAFAEPGRVFAEIVEAPDAQRYLTLCRAVEGPVAGFGERIRRTAILLGCEADAASLATVYGRALAAAQPLPIGPACRLCERPGCLSRAEPPLTRPLGLDAWVGGLTPFEA